MKKINGQEIAADWVVFAVEYSIDTDDGPEDGFVIECDDEDEARLYRATLNGRIVVKHVYETAYAEFIE